MKLKDLIDREFYKWICVVACLKFKRIAQLVQALTRFVTHTDVNTDGSVTCTSPDVVQDVDGIFCNFFKVDSTLPLEHCVIRHV